MSIVEGLALPGVLVLIKKMSEPATQELVVRRARENPDCPPLNMRHRRRLRQLIRTDRAVAAMFEQDDVGAASLSFEIARDVFKEEESVRSRVLAQILIAEIPNCLPTDQKTGLLAYRLRAISEAVGDVGNDLRGVGEDVREVSESLSDLRQFLESRVSTIQVDPVVLIAGPLKALGLEEEYAAIQSLEVSAPAEAAARLSILISRIGTNGYTEELLPFMKQRAELLTRAGDVSAADAWMPLVTDYLSAGRGIGLHEPVQAWNSIARNDNAPAWLAARIDVVQALERWQYGDVDAQKLLGLAIAASEAGDPSGTVWAVYAAESCLADGRETTIAAARDQLLQYANTSHDIGLSTRLLLAVADATQDEALWRQMLAEAEPAGVRYAADLSALIHARHARQLYWTNQLGLALAEFRLAIDRGTDAQIWEDAADWAESAAHVMQLRDSVLLNELAALQQQEKAFRAADGRSLLIQAENLQLTALTSLVEAEGGGGSIRRAWSALGRFRRRSIVLGAVRKELESHVLTGRLHAQLDQPEMAIGHFIRGGDLKRAAEVAEKLTRFHDCREDVSEQQPNRQRAVALRVVAEEADLIPDDEVSD
ncbi:MULTISPECIES: hypothetical protein [unclassified Mycobacterium]|uniref:hypothetical protein n=1 Tax=unclassified Mycobacterium TaxID=2642494 RepID=UPI000A4555C1|nr:MULTISPECIES: hypothetical protein [unclassified Mycobacterium]